MFSRVGVRYDSCIFASLLSVGICGEIFAKIRKSCEDMMRECGIRFRNANIMAF